MKNYLRVYISHPQDNWVDYLFIVTFAVNNHINTSTRVKSFFADNGFHPQIDIELPQTYEKTSQKTEFLSVDQIIAN